MLSTAIQMNYEAVLRQGGWEFMSTPQGVSLRRMGTQTDAPPEGSLRQALEIGFYLRPEHSIIGVLQPSSAERVGAGLDTVEMGQGKHADGELQVHRDLFFQNADSWLSRPAVAPFPLRYVLAEGRRHPLRPAKPTGIVYRRNIPWLQKTISFRTVELENDLLTFSGWMNDPVVARFWREEGDLPRHRDYLRRIAEDKHTIGLIGCFDDEPFGYFEVYWAKEDRIAPFCEAADYDRGWHVLVGDPKYRGKPFLTAWMPSMAHYIFLSDCRTQRIVIEPQSDNDRMIKNLTRCGYAMLKEFEFPHKRAVLGMLLRERFFSDALWFPRD